MLELMSLQLTCKHIALLELTYIHLINTEIGKASVTIAIRFNSIRFVLDSICAFALDARFPESSQFMRRVFDFDWLHSRWV